MQRVFDFIFVRILIFIISFFAFSFIASKFYMAIIYALLSTAAISLLIAATSKHRRKGKMGFSNFLQRCILGGGDYILPLTAKLLAVHDCEISGNNLSYTQGDRKILIINTLRFGNVSPDEIIRLYNTAKASGASELYILARLLDRRSMAIANSFRDIKYIVISARRLYQMSARRGLLPKESREKLQRTFGAGDIFRIVLSKSLAPKYLFTAAILGFMTMFTPLKTYYIIMTSIALIMAILSFSGISHSIAPTKLGVFGRNIPKSGNNPNSDNDTPSN